MITKTHLLRFLAQFLIFLIKCFVSADRQAVLQSNGDFLPHIRLSKDLLDTRRYDKRVRPSVEFTTPIQVTFSMSLYQILAINEKMQHLELNVWVIQKWTDGFLGWNPHKYGSINSTVLPYDKIWLPDTYVYNSVVMNREETERYINVVVSTEYWNRKRGAVVKFMYPALYRTTCKLNIKFFPYDQQTCTLIISSWTSDKGGIDYTPEFDSVNLENFIPNEEWVVVSFNLNKTEKTFVCCPHPWVLLKATLVVRRKPLYYIVHLVIPTSVITLVAVTGFFTPASTSNERREKLSLGIDSLLAHSLLLMMVSEQMPTTSDYVPLFGIFYLSIIAIIFIGTLFTALILNIHLQKTYNKLIPPLVSYIFFHKIAVWLAIKPSTTLLELWIETGVRIEGFEKISGTKTQCVLKNRTDVIEKRLHEKPEKKGKLNIKDKNHHYLLASDPSSILTKNVGVQSNYNNITLFTSRPSSIQSISPRYDLSPSTASDSIGSRITGRRNTPQASIAARNNWKRLAQRVSAKHREEYADIPFVDSSASQIGGSRPAWVNRSPSTSIPLSTLQFLGLQSGGSRGSVGSNDDAMLRAKLRRRNAQEWEFLATVLDRVLLIVFSILVTTVTIVVIFVGQVIHFNYALEDKRNNVTSKYV